MLTKMAARVWWLKPVLWLVPKVANVLWATLPGSHIPVNLAELEEYKKYMAQRHGLSNAVNEMIDFFDPAHGTSEQFIQALRHLEGEPLSPEACMGFNTSSPAWTSRVLAGDESILEAVYQLRQHMPPDHFLHQDFMFWIRIVQVGRRLTDQAPLGDLWRIRIEAAVRKFFYDQHGIFRGSHQIFVIGGMNAGIIFLVHQQGHGRLALLDELIAWSATGEAGMRQWPETPPERQPAALLMYILELTGVESGLTNPLSRQTVFFGIRCFLKHGPKLDDVLWDRLATILVRRSVYTPDEVAHFMDEISCEWGKPSVEEQAPAVKGDKLVLNGEKNFLASFHAKDGAILRFVCRDLPRPEAAKSS
jgi:hypothetical protein